MHYCFIKKLLIACFMCLLSLGLLSTTAAAQVSVLTQHNNNGRSGVNLAESILTTSNVNVNTFGKLFSVKIDGYMFAQPLYVPALTINGGTHNVVYAATAADSVFAFDADNGTSLWQKNYGTPVPSSVIQTENIQVQVGIISTPAIDPSTNTMYMVTKTYENSQQIFRLHALDITTGNEKLGGPVVISASISGNGSPSDGNGHVVFQAAKENQRAAVTLADGTVYLAFASHEDYTPYHGWVLGYSASTLQQLYVFNDTRNGSQGGIWQSGQGLAVDASNNLYLMVGNGTADVQEGGADYGEGFIKLSSSLVPLDYFIPNNFDSLNSSDEDVSAGGPVLISGTNYIAGAGKQGLMYVVDTTNMGHYNASKDPIHQEFSTGRGLWGSPIFWNNPTNPTLYVWNEGTVLKAFPFSNGSFATTPSSQSSVSAPTGSVGGALSISSNNNLPGTNILWASIPLSDPDHQTVEGQLFAYDATDLSKELWDTRKNDSRDDLGNYSKFVAPTVANGKVYLATDSNQLVVYGLLNSSGATLPDGNYAVTNAAGTLVWDDPHFDKSEGTNVQLYPSNGGSNQTWTFTSIGNGYYTITNEASGLVLDDPGLSSKPETDLIQWPSNGGNNQHWLVKQSGTGYTITNQSSDLLIDAGSNSKGTFIEQNTASGNSNQLWYIVKTSPPLANGTYTVTNGTGNLVWDDPYFHKTEGTNVQLWPSNGGSNQKWTFTSIGNGYYTITNENSGLVLDDPASNPNPGTELIQWPSNGGANQHWLVKPSGTGYTITNQSSGLLVDAGTNAQGQYIQQDSASGATGQLWYIQ